MARFVLSSSVSLYLTNTQTCVSGRKKHRLFRACAQGELRAAELGKTHGRSRGRRVARARKDAQDGEDADGGVTGARANGRTTRRQGVGASVAGGHGADRASGHGRQRGAEAREARIGRKKRVGGRREGRKKIERSLDNGD